MARVGISAGAQPALLDGIKPKKSGKKQNFQEDELNPSPLSKNVRGKFLTDELYFFNFREPDSSITIRCQKTGSNMGHMDVTSFFAIFD